MFSTVDGAMQLSLEVEESLRDGIVRMAFSMDGSQIAYCGTNSLLVSVIDALSGSSRFRCDYGERVESITFCHDGSAMACSMRGTGLVCVWDLRSGEQTFSSLKGHSDEVCAVRFTPDDQHIITASSDMTLRIWDLKGNISTSSEDHGNEIAVDAVAFSPSGKQCVCIKRDQLFLWDSGTGSMISTVSIKEESYLVVRYVTFSPSGGHVLAVSNRCMYVWDLGSRSVSVETPSEFDGYVRCTSRTANLSNPQIYCVAMDMSPFTQLRIWDWATCSLAKMTKPHRSLVSSSACSPDCKRIALGNEYGGIAVVDTDSGDVLLSLTAVDKGGGHIQSISFSPDGNFLVSGSDSGELRWWDARDGSFIGGSNEHTDGISSVLYFRDGCYMISRSSARQIVWDSQTRMPVNVDSLLLAALSEQDVPNLHMLADGWVIGLDNKAICWVPVENRGHNYSFKRAAHNSRILLAGRTMTLMDISSVSLASV